MVFFLFNYFYYVQWKKNLKFSNMLCHFHLAVPSLLPTVLVPTLSTHLVKTQVKCLLLRSLPCHLHGSLGHMAAVLPGPCRRLMVL